MPPTDIKTFQQITVSLHNWKTCEHQIHSTNHYKWMHTLLLTQWNSNSINTIFPHSPASCCNKDIYLKNNSITKWHKSKCNIHKGTECCYCIYTGCPRRNVPDIGIVFLVLKCTDITQNTYIQSWKVTEIMAREKCGLLAVPRTAPVQLTRYVYTKMRSQQS